VPESDLFLHHKIQCLFGLSGLPGCVIAGIEYNNADGRLSPRLEGASQKHHCGVAVLAKGLSFPANSALHWRFCEALNPTI